MQGRPYNRREERAMGRQIRLREQGYDTYDAYLKSPAWRSVKQRYRASDLPQVCMCGSENVDLHHTTYERVGRERLDDLVPLCRDCHAHAHALESVGLIDLDLKGFYYDAERAVAYGLIEDARKAAIKADRDERRDARHRKRIARRERLFGTT